MFYIYIYIYIYSRLIQIIINSLGVFRFITQFILFVVYPRNRSFRLIVTFDFLYILYNCNANYIISAGQSLQVSYQQSRKLLRHKRLPVFNRGNARCYWKTFSSSNISFSLSFMESKKDRFDKGVDSVTL